MDEFTKSAMKLADDGWTVKQVHEVALALRQNYNHGLWVASQMAEEWAALCSGGTGQGGDGYKNLASAIIAKQRTA